MINGDSVSLFCKKAVDVVFVKNSVGTSLGVFLGVILNCLYGMLEPVVKPLIQIKHDALNLIFFISVGIFGFNIGPYRRRHELPESIQNSIDLIDRMEKEGRITKAEAKTKYRELVKMTFDHVKLKLDSEIVSEAPAGAAASVSSKK